MADNPAVVSGEEDHGESNEGDYSAEEDRDDDDDDDEDDTLLKFGTAEGDADQLYCPDMDDTDEAWVHQNLRLNRSEVSKSGAKNQASQTGNGRESGQQQQEDITAESERPPTDAVLSCPCCFTTVCMDCQRHTKYHDQFRAMFVMNISVNWESNLVFDPSVKLLVHEKQNSSQSPIRENQEFYYAVNCINCQTQVAVLDMREELYHFSQCLASS
mmetsp:Transcript_13524/g.20571  ORF Transcript_13524/g.20571 Transcript_13524/m.20571 type:complete len:215 (+) Transcript_13524:114-758(+)